ncbi:hypothetical protein Avbf_19109 [Armadillidium vulgare]|nr:hypothetical protein Avbf_19109 [Armadillidium vulgare]
MADTTSNTSEKKKDPFVDLETRKHSNFEKMSFKNYICFFTFSVFISAMVDPIPSQSEPEYDEEFYDQFEDLISSHVEAYDLLIDLDPRAYVDFAKKLSEAEKVSQFW